jgi:hypothetical protein
MLTDGGCTAVVIGSPMHLHVAQSIAALERGVHVLCEVTAGVTIEECRDLVFAAERSDALFMMAENINYDRTSVLINSIVDAGKMGDVRTHFVELILPTSYAQCFGHTIPGMLNSQLCVLQVYYAEGEYLHDVKALAVATPWRRHWQLGIRGLTYCSESVASHQLTVPSILYAFFL